MTMARRATMVAAALLAGVSAAGKAEMRGWTLCTPGSFRSCHSVALITTPIMSGGVRTGTTVTIQTTNLQGTEPSDNSGWSWLYQIYFWRNGPVAADRSGTPGLVPGVLGGTAGGSPGATYLDYDFTVFPGSFANIYGMQVAGCNQGGLPASTCGSGAWVSFTWGSSGLWDAGEFSTAFIVEGTSGAYCFSDPAAYTPSPRYPACDVLSEFNDATPVPEPVTIALLGTGLAGVGAVRGRRRERRED